MQTPNRIYQTLGNKNPAISTDLILSRRGHAQIIWLLTIIDFRLIGFCPENNNHSDAYMIHGQPVGPRLVFGYGFRFHGMASMAWSIIGAFVFSTISSPFPRIIPHPQASGAQSCHPRKLNASEDECASLSLQPQPQPKTDGGAKRLHLQNPSTTSACLLQGFNNSTASMRYTAAHDVHWIHIAGTHWRDMGSSERSM